MYKVDFDWAFLDASDSTLIDITSAEVVVESIGGHDVFLDDSSHVNDTLTGYVLFYNVKKNKYSEISNDNPSFDISIQFEIDSLNYSWDTLIYFNDMGFSSNSGDDSFINFYINVDSIVVMKSNE